MMVVEFQGEIAIDFPSFQQFIENASRSISVISRETRGEYACEDITSELWITAADLQEKKNIEINFVDPQHQALILSYTFQRLVHYCEKKVRTAKRLDHGYFDDAPSLYDITADQEGENPLDQLVLEQQAEAEKDVLDALGISIGAVWLAMLDRFGGRMVCVARFLKLSVSHSYRCYRKVQWLSATQMPLALEARNSGAVRCLRPWRPCKIYRIPEQLDFDFEARLELA